MPLPNPSEEPKKMNVNPLLVASGVGFAFTAFCYRRAVISYIINPSGLDKWEPYWPRGEAYSFMACVSGLVSTTSLLYYGYKRFM